MKNKVYFALGLHMHQPPENLELLITHNDWEAQQIIRCYERAARYAHLFKKDGFFHVGFSGTLLEQFQDPSIIKRYKKHVDIPKMIETYRKAKNIELIGMGFNHPIFPLIPKEDWQEQLQTGRDIMKDMFGRAPKGFWPSEMAFSMEMVPAIKAAGYEYVVVDHVHVQPQNDKDKADYFKPYKATFDKASITVIPRNRDISNAQESGLNPGWFTSEVMRKLSDRPKSKYPSLVTTWSDGENGGWFRQMDENSGFFGYFFKPFMEMVRAKETNIQPIKISDYLKEHPPQDEAFVQTGAWNVASTSGYDFSQWNGSESQKQAINELFKTSRRYWQLKNTKLPLKKKEILDKARKSVLDAETSCYLFWGDAWIPKLYEKSAQANALLDQI